MDQCNSNENVFFYEICMTREQKEFNKSILFWKERNLIYFHRLTSNKQHYIIFDHILCKIERMEFGHKAIFWTAWDDLAAENSLWGIICFLLEIDEDSPGLFSLAKAEIRSLLILSKAEIRDFVSGFSFNLSIICGNKFGPSSEMDISESDKLNWGWFCVWQLFCFSVSSILASTSSRVPEESRLRLLAFNRSNLSFIFLSFLARLATVNYFSCQNMKFALLVYR